MATTSTSLLGQLILVRLLAPGRGISPAKLRQDLLGFVEHRGGRAEWNEALEEALRQLVNGGLVTRRPLSLSEAGQRSALEFVGLSSVPARVSWRDLKNTYLMARALGVAIHSPEARKGVADADRLRGLILKRHFALAIGDYPNFSQALHALAWKQLHVDSGKPFSHKTVLAQVFGLSEAIPSNWDDQIVTKVTSARNNSADELRRATLRQWVDQMLTASSGEQNGKPAPAVEPAFNLAGFAEGVQEAARASDTGRFGPNKVFISHVWRKLRQEGMFPGLTETEFKQRLTEANREGLLALSRADLVEAMDPGDVADSETHYLNATFHFIQVS